MLRKRILPYMLSDWMAFLFVLSSVISIYFFEIFIVSPYVHQERLAVHYFHCVCGFFIFVNILANLFKMMLTDTTSGSTVLPSVLKPKWRFCPACESNSPPRSFHCGTCKKCVLKRDHHCTFAGCCVGHNNFRFFFFFLAYLFVGASYSTILNMFYIWDILDGFSLMSVIAHIVPFLFWMGGYFNFFIMLETLLSVISITGSLFVASLLVFHGRQMLKNQTTYEKNNGIIDYDLGWKQNIIESLGEKWLIAWIFPTIPSELPSDGIKFIEKNEFATVGGKRRKWIRTF